MTVPETPAPDAQPDLTGALDAVEGLLLGAAPSLTRSQVAEQAGVPLETATSLWNLLGFPQTGDGDVAFTEADVRALRDAAALFDLRVLTPERQAALVRTWARSFARLAEWQTRLLAETALESGDPAVALPGLAEEVLPRVEALQAYIWRRHLASTAGRTLTVQAAGPAEQLAVCFVDIVGYTSQSKAMGEAELVGWLEEFEDACGQVAVDHGGRIIKNIGDEVMVVADDPVAAAEIALTLTERGGDADDPFPQVRAGVAFGDVVSRLGDVFGPTVNIAARLTSLARPGTVLVDRGAFEALGEAGPATEDGADDADDAHTTAYSFRRLRRASVKGYSRLQPWLLRRARNRRADQRG